MSTFTATTVDVMPEPKQAGRRKGSGKATPYLDGQIWKLTIPDPNARRKMQSVLRSAASRIHLMLTMTTNGDDLFVKATPRPVEPPQ